MAGLTDRELRDRRFGRNTIRLVVKTWRSVWPRKTESLVNVLASQLCELAEIDSGDMAEFISEHRRDYRSLYR